MVPVSPSINLIIKKTHKRDWSLPHFCLIPPYCHSFIRFLYVFLLSEISIPCFNHFKNLPVRWISPGMLICFKIGRFLSFYYFHLSLVIFLIIECIAKPNILCQWLYTTKKRFSFSRVMWKNYDVCIQKTLLFTPFFSFTKFTINFSPLKIVEIVSFKNSSNRRLISLIF